MSPPRLPPRLPSLRALTRELKSLNQRWTDGPGAVVLHRDRGPWVVLECESARGWGESVGWEIAPGDGLPFDATAAARRLLAAARDAGYR